jgi:hypothetical protein
VAKHGWPQANYHKLLGLKPRPPRNDGKLYHYPKVLEKTNRVFGFIFLGALRAFVVQKALGHGRSGAGTRKPQFPFLPISKTPFFPTTQAGIRIAF